MSVFVWRDDMFLVRGDGNTRKSWSARPVLSLDSLMYPLSTETQSAVSHQTPNIMGHTRFPIVEVSISQRDYYR